MAHATNMAAMNAARKQFGKNWKDFAKLEKLDGEWYVQVLQPAQSATDDAVQGMVDAANEDLPAPPAEVIVPAEVLAPSVPSAPVEPAHEAVTIESTPAPAPAIPPALLAPTIPSVTVPSLPPALAPVAVVPMANGEPAQVDPAAAADLAAMQAAADAQANAALVAGENRMGHTTCPNCGSEELYHGRCNEGGVVVDEEFIEGCHHCNWEVDTRNAVQVPRPRISTAAKPTKLVWAVADEMVAKAKAAGTAAPKRKDVIDECVRRGIAYGTARTQYQHWFKCIADQAVAPLAVIGADGKVTMTNGGAAQE